MASRLQDVILRGTSGARPLATTVAPGTLYYSTDLQTTERSSGSAWETYADTGGGGGTTTTVIGPQGRDGEAEESYFIGSAGATQAQNTRTIGVVVDGAGSAITTGVKGYKSCPFAGTIIANRVLADQSGSIVFDVWKDTYANYPPTVADTITASAKPTLSSAIKSEDTTLTGWTKSIVAGDVLGFNVDSAATVTRVTLELVVIVA